MAIPKISLCLWFDGQAEEAARFYTSVFTDSSIIRTTRYPDVGKEIHGHEEGDVLTVDFMLNGHLFQALNGGPEFKFNEAVSVVINCDTQEEVDHYWNKLKEGGDEKAQQCGWLKDKFGVSWQIVPKAMEEMFDDHKSEATKRVMQAMLKMKKLDIAELESAYNG